jgi:hypothetical protein
VISRCLCLVLYAGGCGDILVDWTAPWNRSLVEFVEQISDSGHPRASSDDWNSRADSPLALWQAAYPKSVKSDDEVFAPPNPPLATGSSWAGCCPSRPPAIGLGEVKAELLRGSCAAVEFPNIPRVDFSSPTSSADYGIPSFAKLSRKTATVSARPAASRRFFLRNAVHCFCLARSPANSWLSPAGKTEGRSSLRRRKVSSADLLEHGHRSHDVIGSESE